MEMNWLVLTIAVAAVAWIAIRRQLKKKEVEETPTEEVKEEEAPAEEAVTEETPTEEVKEEEAPAEEVKEDDVAEGTEKTGKE